MAAKHAKDPLKPVTGIQIKLVFGFGLGSLITQYPNSSLELKNPRPRPKYQYFWVFKFVFKLVLPD